MQFIRWRGFAVYGSALLLCQALGGCREAVTVTQQSEDSAKAGDNLAIAADAPLVIAFGDSLYAGYQLAPNEGLSPQLQAALQANGVEARVQNAGVSGDTTAAGLQRLGFVLDSGAAKPDLVLLGLGGNDMLRGIGPQQTRENLIAMLDELQRRGIPVLLTGMVAAPNMGRAYGEEFNAIFGELAQRDGVSLYPFMLEGVITNPAWMLDDNVHPNAQGVKHIAEALAPLVAQQLPEKAQAAGAASSG